MEIERREAIGKFDSFVPMILFFLSSPFGSVFIHAFVGLPGEILKLNPSYKAPADYKPLLKEAVVPIPVSPFLY